MSTGERLDNLEFSVDGDNKDNSDYGIKGIVQDHESRIKDLERDRKWISGLVMAALIAACTYFFSQLNNDNGNDSTNNNDNNTRVVGDNPKHRRRGENYNN